jgi:hypothetical protein
LGAWRPLSQRRIAGLAQRDRSQSDSGSASIAIKKIRPNSSASRLCKSKHPPKTNLVVRMLAPSATPAERDQTHKVQVLSSLIFQKNSTNKSLFKIYK